MAVPLEEDLEAHGLDSRLIAVLAYYKPNSTYLVPVICFFLTLQLSSFWTSRGCRCRLFSPPVFAFNFYRA